MTEAPISLATLMVPSRTVTMDHPEFSGFSVDLCFLAKEELLKLRSRCITTSWDKKSHEPKEVLNEDKFLVEYSKAIIKGWKGLTFAYLEELLLVDVSAHSPTDELPYTEENARLLMTNGVNFDEWVTSTVGELENFTQTK